MITKQTIKFNGLTIKMLRERAGIPPGAFAKKAGISVRSLYNIEHARSPNPRLSMVAKLATALDLTIDQLVYELPKELQ